MTKLMHVQYDCAYVLMFCVNRAREVTRAPMILPVKLDSTSALPYEYVNESEIQVRSERGCFPRIDLSIYHSKRSNTRHY